MSEPTLSSNPVLDPFEALIRLFRNVPRKGPGTEACTLRALRACQPLPAKPAVLDLGCGSGVSTLILAKTLGFPVTAVDACAPFLEELQRHAHEQGLSDLVSPLCLDFAALDFPPGSFDLLWSEGAIYNLGWAAGLQAWKPLLRHGGFLALTEAVWFTEDPPEAAKKAWSDWYPAMATIEHCCDVARSLGLEVIGTFPLPPVAWLDYYEPLEQRCREWAPGADAALARTITEMKVEMEIYRSYGNCYGYAFFVLRVP